MRGIENVERCHLEQSNLERFFAFVDHGKGVDDVDLILDHMEVLRVESELDHRNQHMFLAGILQLIFSVQNQLEDLDAIVSDHHFMDFFRECHIREQILNLILHIDTCLSVGEHVV